MASVIVVGGGVAGLAAAYELAARGVTPILIEREKRVGGKIRTAVVEGFLLEDGPESLLTRKPSAVELCRELGIAGEFVARTPRSHGSFIFRQGRLHPLPEGFSGLVPSDPAALRETALLSEKGKRRLLREPEIPRGSGEDESVAAFLTRRFGREAFEGMIEPLVSGIFGGDAGSLSIQAAFPALAHLERRQGFVSGGGAAPASRGTGTEPPTRPERASDAAPAAPSGVAAEALPPFVSFRRGMQELVTGLSEALGRDRMLLGLAARGIARRGGRLAVTLDDGTTREADALVLATQPAATAALLSSLDPTLAAAHAEIPTASTLVVNLGFRSEELPAALDGYGYLTPAIERRLFHGCTWSSSKWPARAPQGYALLRLYGGKYGQEELIGRSDDEIGSEALAELSETLEVKARPVVRRIVRWRQAIPQYNLGHGERIRTIEAALPETPGLFLAGAAYGGVGIPDCIRSGRLAALSAARYLQEL